MSRTFKITNNDVDLSGWYKSKGEDNATLCVTNSDRLLKGAIRLNTDTQEPQFEGYNGDNWVVFNATKGDTGDKGDNFGKLVRLENMDGGEGKLFQHSNIDLSSGADTLNVRSLKSGCALVNEETKSTIEITNQYGYININPLPQPHMWDFCNYNTDTLKSSPSEQLLFKAYGDVSIWKVKKNSSVVKGQSVRIIGTDGELAIEPLLYEGVVNIFRKKLSLLGIALEDAKDGRSCRVCTRGVTTVRCTNDVDNHFMGDGDVSEVGLPGLIAQNGFVFNCKVKPSVDYIKAGYFLESGGIADSNKYALFYVNP